MAISAWLGFLTPLSTRRYNQPLNPYRPAAVEGIQINSRCDRAAFPSVITKTQGASAVSTPWLGARATDKGRADNPSANSLFISSAAISRLLCGF
jgi:hypothetical protein